jgi:hypothetical protein
VKNEMKRIMGIFSNVETADIAYSDLIDAGFNSSNISVISKDTNVEKTETKGPIQNAVGGGAAGAVTGGAIGGIAGILLAAGTLSLPGIGPLLIGGPLLTALGITGGTATAVSGALTGAAAGGLLGALTGLGLPESTAKVYSEKIAGGSVVLSVEADESEIDNAQTILNNHGAEDVVVAGK